MEDIIKERLDQGLQITLYKGKFEGKTGYYATWRDLKTGLIENIELIPREVQKDGNTTG